MSAAQEPKQISHECALAMYRAINNYFAVIERIANVDETWQWAMNEMSDAVSEPWSAAIAQMREAAAMADEQP